MKTSKKIILSEREMPKQWYNIMADMPNKPMPPIHPVTKQPVGPEDRSCIPYGAYQTGGIDREVY